MACRLGHPREHSLSKSLDGLHSGSWNLYFVYTEFQSQNQHLTNTPWDEIGHPDRQIKGQTNKQASSDCSALLVEISLADYNQRRWSAEGGVRRKKRQDKEKETTGQSFTAPCKKAKCRKGGERTKWKYKGHARNKITKSFSLDQWWIDWLSFFLLAYQKKKDTSQYSNQCISGLRMSW